jgi:predicted outer membrane protein
MGGMAPAVDQRHAAMLNQLASASGRDFDHLYARMQVMAHQEALALHGGYAQAGTDPGLVTFARQVTPHIQHHLVMARRLSGARG